MPSTFKVICDRCGHEVIRIHNGFRVESESFQIDDRNESNNQDRDHEPVHCSVNISLTNHRLCTHFNFNNDAVKKIAYDQNHAS